MLEFLAARLFQVVTASSSREPGGSAEVAQDMVSCLYLLLQRFGNGLEFQKGSAAQNALLKVGKAMILILKVRDLCTPFIMIGKYLLSYWAAYQSLFNIV